ncbi:MAG TPA: hypothetical protein VNA89_00195 [Gemmatimonadaceae bacterium]|nr:hypothetical protein [Gemmatimonadaceae bacterium]
MPRAAVAPAPVDLDELRARWESAWPDALAAWSRFTRLRPPTLCLTTEAAAAEGLESSFAMIRLTDQAVVVSLPGVAASGVEALAREVLAHEIGHHVLAPATLTDHARTIARMRWALPTVEQHAPMVANLYTDLLINDRLQRSAGLRMADVYRALAAGAGAGPLWTLYLRIYELLWGLERGSLGAANGGDRIDGDAWLGARLVRSYAREWLDGSGRFAALLFPYLLEDKKSAAVVAALLDTARAGVGGDPSGLTGEEPGEREGGVHPARDPDLSGLGDGDDSLADVDDPPADAGPNVASGGQARQPFEYGEILAAAGIVASEEDAAVRYYRERALPHLVRMPSRIVPERAEPLPEGLEPWDIGHPLDAADWIQTVLLSPRVIPGMTTVQRVWGTMDGGEPRRLPLDVDIYVDSSGSMADPRHVVSYPALAGAIITLSALRAGARVQATLWSGKRQFASTPGFVRDETALLRVLTGYIGGATAFPIHVLRDTYASRAPGERPAHILVISDDGVSTMFDQDERGRSGWDVAAAALARAGGGGTFVLNLPQHWDASPPADTPLAAIARARDEQGWRVHRVSSWDDLVTFAAEFSRWAYGAGTRRDEPRRAAGP